MRFRVHCANSETGEEYDWEIECATIQEAEQRAQDAGMLVSRVEPIADAQIVEARRHPIQTPEVRQVAPPTVQVQTQPTRSNSLGIASVILGILAFLICWIPFVAIVSMPVSGLGLLLGLIGLILALTRSGYGIGFPIAGSAVSALALVIASVMGFGMFAATSGVLDEIATELELEQSTAATDAPINTGEADDPGVPLPAEVAEWLDRFDPEAEPTAEASAVEGEADLKLNVSFCLSSEREPRHSTDKANQACPRRSQSSRHSCLVGFQLRPNACHSAAKRSRRAWW